MHKELLAFFPDFRTKRIWQWRRRVKLETISLLLVIGEDNYEV